ncbi:photosynthetic reaction center cytochrome PufC [Sandaracinobacteroides saxicola]|uniref:Photosynthetic reaction center cytochrome c subunit n=1 Tax=Sandaracinobacteroides saxicola TaxID=2759707 RepID=A0A7G5IKT4_9SPHN|nr:photosynthetic reaction center cytochrome PufC [Sandaracinobacteroides saxicola]QMW23976.1 photosynthetic reaction center cytochrome c subunit [Sandaracinobacteroides saxicola]
MMTGRTTAALLGMSLALTGCELGTKVVSQNGYRGTGMDQIVTKSSLTKAKADNVVPPPPYPLESRDGELAKDTYENVQVLGDISSEEFNRLMISITEWVSPDGSPGGGCNYCHNPENLASDEVYTKVVARKMIAMTRQINSNWKSHVQGTGVTCWTCHRGKNVPDNKWAMQVPGNPMTIRGNKRGQNSPVVAVGYSSLPNDIFAPYLWGSQEIRVNSQKALPSDHYASIHSTERTYGLMMRFSTALGVNCTYCHNSNNFGKWTGSTPQRVTAWYGIRMARDINNNYIDTVANVMPAKRLGPAGDAYKVNCATCHQGVNKPLNGVSMLPDHPALAGPRMPVAPVAAPVVATPAAPATPVAAAAAAPAA